MKEFPTKKKVFLKEGIPIEQFVSDSGNFYGWKMEKLLGRNAVGELYRASKEIKSDEIKPDEIKSEPIKPEAIKPKVAAPKLGAGNDDGPKRRVAAFRIFDPSLSRNPRLVKRFLMEAEKLQSIDHPNIVTVIECGRAEDGTPYIARPYIEGLSLQEVVASCPLPFERVIEILLSICEALKEGARHELLHRNLNPSNVLIDDDGKVMVADFGLTKGLPVEGSDTLGMTNYGALSQDVRYLSPEQIADKRLDTRADLYSLGCIAYLLFTGEELYEGLKGLSIVNVKMLDKYDDQAFENIKFKGSDKARARAIKGAAALVANLVRANEDHRYKNADDLIKSLNDLKNGKDIKPIFVPSKSKTISKRQIASFAGLAVLSTLLTAFYMFSQRSEEAIMDSFVGQESKAKQEPSNEAIEGVDIVRMHDSAVPPGAYGTQFSDEEVKRFLPGTWNYTWGDALGDMKIEKVFVMNNARRFLGLIENHGVQSTVIGSLSKKDDKLTLMTDFTLKHILEEGSFLRRTEGSAAFSSKELVISSVDQEKGFAAKKTHPEQRSPILESFKIDPEVLNRLEGPWLTVNHGLGLPERFYLHPVGNQGLFEMRDRSRSNAKEMGETVLGLMTVCDNKLILFSCGDSMFTSRYDSEAGCIASTGASHGPRSGQTAIKE